MIRMMKFWPINWHSLTCYEPLECGDACFLTGHNGSGKSTILDAMTLLLFARTNQFNKAAEGNKSYDRSLVGYVRGLRTLSSKGDSSDDYMRPGATVTHLTAEFMNLKTNRYFTIGVTIEMKDVRESNTPKMAWWVSDGHHINEFQFFMEENGKKRVSTLAELKQATPAGKDIQTEEVQYKVRRRWSAKGIFNLANENIGSEAEANRWFRNMLSAMAYSPSEFSDLNEFLRTRVAPESPPDISLFQQILDEMTETQHTVATLLERQKSLSEIMSVYDEYKTLSNEAAVCERASLYAGLCRMESDLKKQTEAIEQQEQRVSALQKAENDLRSERERLNLAIHDLQNNNLSGHIKTLKAQLNETKKKIQDLSSKLSSYLNSLSSAGAFAKNANAIIGREAISLEPLETLRQAGADGNIFMLQSFLKSLSAANEELVILQVSLREEQKKLQGKLASIRKELEILQSSSVLGSDAQRSVKEAIQAAFRKAGVIDQPYFLCELLDYKDSSWAYPVEAHMGASLFAIIVSPDNYRLAANVYKEYALQHPNVFGVQLVDSSYYFGKTFSCKEKSLASVLTTDNVIAEAYINDSYGNVHLAEDASRPEWKNDVSIDKDCMRYAHHCYGHMRPVRYLSIGAAARKQRLEACEAEKLSLTKELNDVQKRTVQCGEALATYKKNINALVVNGQVVLTEVGSLSAVVSEQKKISDELEEYQNNPELQKLQEMEADAAKIGVELNHAMSETSSAQKKAAEIKVRISELEAKIASSKEKISLIQQECPEQYESAVRSVADYMEKGTRISYGRAEKDFFNLAEEKKSKAVTVNGNLSGLQTSHCRTFDMDYETNGAATIGEYRQAYQAISSNSLPAAQQKLERARTQTYQQFQSNIISTMGEGPIAYNNLIRDINRILDNISIGGRKFRFDKLKPEVGKEDIFEMISSSSNSTYTDQVSFANLTFDDKYADTRRELFDRLAAAKEEEQANILDYRNYCRFGITVISADNANKRGSLDKLFGSNSGSENQAPIYVILAAALCAQYNRKNRSADPINDSDTCRLMFIDECFDKMDASNTQYMIDLLSKQLGLQIIIAAPHDRYSKVANCVDSAWLMVDNKRGRTCSRFSKAEFLAKLNKHKLEIQKAEEERAQAIREGAAENDLL